MLRLPVLTLLVVTSVAAACRRPESAAMDSLAGGDTTAPRARADSIIGRDSVMQGPFIAVPTPAPGAGAADTVRGTVAEVGSHPVTSVVVRTRSGPPVTITGALAGEIGRAAGAEVWVRGRRGPEGLEAERYAVRSVDGEPAVDGTLELEGGSLVLVTPAGRRPIARPPQALRRMIGARVWLVGQLDAGITSYGVLRDAPEER